MKIWFLAVFLCLAPIKNQARLVEKLVAQVGEDLIFLSDIYQFQKYVGHDLLPDSVLFKLFAKKALLKNRSLALEFLITSSMLYQLAKAERLAVKPKVFEKDGSIKMNREESSLKNSWAQKLQSQKITLDQFWDLVDTYATNDLLISRQVISKIIIPESEINGYYLNKYGKPLFETFTYNFLSVAFPKNKEGLKKSQFFVKAASRDTSFLKLAKRQGLKARSSILNPLEINPKMYKALKTMSVSQVSNPLALDRQLYVLKLKWKEPYLKPTEQKKQMEIRSLLFEKALKKAVKTWIQQQKTSFPINIHFP